MQRIISTWLELFEFVALGSKALPSHDRRSPKAMLRPYIVYYKYRIPTDKTQGAVKQFRVYATSLDEARKLASRHANYPNVEVLNVKPA